MNVVAWTWIIAAAFWALAMIVAIRASHRHPNWNPRDAFLSGFWFGGWAFAALIFTLSGVARTWY
jgi:hypothetical protein